MPAERQIVGNEAAAGDILLHYRVDDYIRKQTLTSAERFVTEELKELEKKILSAEEKSLRIELAIFEKIKAYLYQNLAVLKQTAKIIAKTDCLFSLACAALNGNYKKPQIMPENGALVIEKVVTR